MSELHGELPQRLNDAISDIVLGQEEVVRRLVLLVLAGGHGLLEGVPGSGKTLAAQVLSNALGCTFRRVQFTPDLMPADLVGTEIWHAGRGEFQIRKGPIFCDVLLADELNRTPPKTQSALLEAMEERQVTLGGESFPLGSAFTVVATQNSIEFEGTYPLPEAQLDRFMMRITVPPMEAADELRVYQRFASGEGAHGEARRVQPVMSREELTGLRSAVRELSVDEAVLRYAQQIVSGTRKHSDLLVGASVRAGLHLLAVAKASAVFAGRDYVTPDDVRAEAEAVLAHRVLVHPDALVDGVQGADVLNSILAQVQVPR